MPTAIAIAVFVVGMGALFAFDYVMNGPWTD